MSRRGWTWSGLPGLCGPFKGFTPMQIITGFRLLSHDRYIPLVYICTRMRMHLTVEYGYTIFGFMGPEDPGTRYGAVHTVGSSPLRTRFTLRLTKTMALVLCSNRTIKCCGLELGISQIIPYWLNTVDPSLMISFGVHPPV